MSKPARAPSAEMGRTGPDQCVALGEVGKRRWSVLASRDAVFSRAFTSASEGMHTAGGVDAELPVPHARGLGKSSQTGSSSVRPNAQQCLWSTRRNNPRELHWPANTPTVRAKYGMKLETDGGCKQGVVMSLKNRDHVLRPRYCTALPLLVLAGDWVWPFGSSKLRLTSTSSCCCCPPVVAGPSSLLDDSRGTDIGLVGGFNFLVCLFHT